MSGDFLRPKVGLALSGSGNRSAFYIGFLEALQQQRVPIDYISACSGGSLIAAAFACGALKEFKEVFLSLNQESLRQYIGKKSGRGGLYSLDGVEEKLREFTRGLTFEEVRPLMSFVTVDIETGQQINLCMGDIARAARVSCTLPGIFEPVKWGSRTLVDGGLLSLVPLESLKQFPVDITIGINMRGTKHIFSQRQLTMKKYFNFLKRLLFLDEMEEMLGGLLKKDSEPADFEINPSIFTVLGKSLDLAIEASKKDSQQDLTCDLMITPDIPLLKRDVFVKFSPYYEMGRKSALENAPVIFRLIEQKTAIMNKEAEKV